MPLTLGTHWGPFHADDVLACSLIRVFMDADAAVVRTRDPAKLSQADIVFDVGGTFDPETLRFDHHQASYTGPLSSAGMVLDWLEGAGHVPVAIAARLRADLVEWVDAVDNGRREPIPGVLDYTRMVEACNKGAGTMAEFDAAFERAVAMTLPALHGIAAAVREEEDAARQVLAAMKQAVEAGSNLILLDRYLPWKGTYFAHGGATHPTEFVAFPGVDGSWRAVAIAPEEGSFDQKQPLPEAWAGLRDDELSTVSGVAGAKFCHKNRFIAVWDTREHLLAALVAFDVVGGDLDR